MKLSLLEDQARAMDLTERSPDAFRRILVIAHLLPLLCFLAGCGGGSIVPVPSGGAFAISGTITGGPMVTVTLSGSQSATTTTDSSGNYSFDNLADGSYVVAPASSNCFSVAAPTQQSVTVSGANVSGVNFTGTDPKLSFCEDFTGSTLGSAWYALNRFGDAGNGEVQCYLPSQDTVGGGNLTITTAVQNVNCDTNNSRSSSYASGQVTWSTFNFTYGTIEFRAKMAGGQGPWPAIWLLGAQCQPANINWSATQGTCNWPAPGSDEIDIAEILNSNHTAVNQQLHSNGHNDACTATTSDVSQNVHVYQFIWGPGSMVWKIDGTTTCTIQQTYVPNTPMFLIINTALGGSGGTITPSTLPQTMQVDYVKVTKP